MFTLLIKFIRKNAKLFLFINYVLDVQAPISYAGSDYFQEAQQKQKKASFRFLQKYHFKFFFDFSLFLYLKMYSEHEELMEFFKITNKNHSYEICKACMKKVRDFQATNESIETCGQFFLRNGMQTICDSTCSAAYFTQFTYSDVTKTIHADLNSFYDVKEKYPSVFTIQHDNDEQKMRFFHIFGRRAHGFICKICSWIKPAKVKNSALKLPKDYVFNHRCGEDEPMSSQNSSSNTSGSMVSKTNISSDSRMNTQPNHPPATRSISADISNSQSTSEQNSMNSSQSMNINLDSRDAESASQLSDGQDSGFRTPDFLIEPDSTIPDLELSSSSRDADWSKKCPNSFTASSGDIKLILKCSYISHSISEFQAHKCKCPIRYGDKMAQTNGGYLAKIIWNHSKQLQIADYLANCLNDDLINDVVVPGFEKDSSESINIKNCTIFNLPKMRNFIVAHNEPSSTQRKKKDLFQIDTQTCRDLIGSSSSVNKFKRLSQTMHKNHLPTPKYLHETIRFERQFLKEFTDTMLFKNQKRTNQSGLGNCYGSIFKKEKFSQFLDSFEEMHPELVSKTVALCVLGDEGRGYLKYTLVYSSSQLKVNARYSIMLFIGEFEIGIFISL